MPSLIGGFVVIGLTNIGRSLLKATCNTKGLKGSLHSIQRATGRQHGREITARIAWEAMQRISAIDTMPLRRSRRLP